MNNHKLLKGRKRNKVLVIIGVTLLTFLIVGFMTRGWIRGDGFKWILDTLYRPQLEELYDEQFSEVNTWFEALGVDSWGDVVGVCDEPMYEGFGVSSGCYVRGQSGQIDNPEQVEANWGNSAQWFDDRMTSGGWTRGTDDMYALGKLLDSDPSPGTNNVTYNRDFGQQECSLRIGYNPVDTENRRVFVEESCSHSIEVFGGY